MKNEELKIKLNQIKNNLDSVISQLKYVQETLNNSITINEETFKNNDLIEIERKIKVQIDNINNKIIPSIEKM